MNEYYKEKLLYIKNDIVKKREEGRYSLFLNEYLNNNLSRAIENDDRRYFELFFEMIDNWNDECNLSLNDGYNIFSYYNDKGNVYAVHRTFLGPIERKNNIPYNRNLNSILNEGLINNGHVFEGGNINDVYPNLALTLTPFNKVEGILNFLAGYKNNNFVIILKFPKELVDEDLQLKKDSYGSLIYRKDNGINYIKKEFIVGVLVKNEDTLDEYYDKDRLLMVSKAITL